MPEFLTECHVELALNPSELLELFGGSIPLDALVSFQVTTISQSGLGMPLVRLTLARHDQQPWSTPPSVPALDRDQKMTAFETAMAVLRDNHPFGSTPEDMKSVAEGVVDAAIAAAKKLRDAA